MKRLLSTLALLFIFVSAISQQGRFTSLTVDRALYIPRYADTSNWVDQKYNGASMLDTSGANNGLYVFYGGKFNRITSLYLSNDTIQGNRTIYVRGGLPNTNSRQLNFDFKTRRPGFPTQLVDYYVQFNQNFGSGPITYFWSPHDSAINQISYVNDGGGVGRGNEGGHLIFGSKVNFTANGYQGGFMTRVDDMPMTVSVEGNYPFQVYTGSPSFPTSLTGKPSFWADHLGNVYLPKIPRNTSPLWLTGIDSATGATSYVPITTVTGSAITTGGLETFTATAGQTDFTTVGTLPSSAYKVFVFRNGLWINKSKAVNTITVPACDEGDTIIIQWYN